MPPNYSYWKRYVDELEKFIVVNNDHYNIVMGDFNVIYDYSLDHIPKLKLISNRGNMLKTVINNLDLIDIARYHEEDKELYTRIDKANKSMLRIDHVYVSKNMKYIEL